MLYALGPEGMKARYQPPVEATLLVTLIWLEFGRKPILKKLQYQFHSLPKCR